MPCPNCGGTLIGDGHTMVIHCEFVDVPLDVEPDASPIYCEGKVKPQDGGCWYCYKVTPPLAFCWEFDTNIHIECIKKQIAKGEYDPELEIIRKEFGL